MRDDLWREVRDEDFTVPATGFLLGGVRRLYALYVKLPENLAHLGNVIQRQDELAVQSCHALSEFLKILRLEVVTVQIPPEIWRVQVEQRSGPVVALQYLFVRKAFKLDAC